MSAGLEMGLRVSVRVTRLSQCTLACRVVFEGHSALGNQPGGGDVVDGEGGRTDDEIVPPGNQQGGGDVVDGEGGRTDDEIVPPGNQQGGGDVVDGEGGRTDDEIVPPGNQ